MRKKAAAVPASKAVIDCVYAVRHPDTGKLTRFRVDRVTTHRTSNYGNPHDYESEIGGVYMENADDPTKTKLTKATIKPDELLGEFTAYKELVAERELQEQAKRVKERADAELALELRKLLYRVTGTTEPNDATEYYQFFRVGKYGSMDSVEMGKNSYEALVTGLKRLLAEADTARSANLIDAS